MSEPLVYFHSTNRPGVKYRALGKSGNIVHLQDVDGVKFDLPMQILMDRRYRLVKESKHA